MSFILGVGVGMGIGFGACLSAFWGELVIRPPVKITKLLRSMSITVEDT